MKNSKQTNRRNFIKKTTLVTTGIISTTLPVRSFANVLDNKKLKNYISQTDIVIHLAAAVGVKNIVNHPLNSLQTNLNGTKYVVDLVSEYNKKLIFVVLISYFIYVVFIYLRMV